MAPRSTISSFPQELLKEIAQCLNTADLVQLCPTSTRFYDAVVWILYRDITLDAMEKAIRCFRTIVTRPQAALAIRRLHLDVQFNDSEVPSDFFLLTASAIQHATFLSLLDFKGLGLVPVFNYLQDVSLEHLTTCIMPCSPETQLFLRRHQNITALTVLPELTTLPLPSAYLPKVDHLIATASVVQALCPIPALETLYMIWDHGDTASVVADTVLLSLSESQNLRYITNAFSVENGVVNALATHLPNVEHLGFKIDLRYTNYKDFLSILGSKLGYFHLLSYLDIDIEDSNTPSIPEISEDFETLFQWGILCPKLQEIALLDFTWHRTSWNSNCWVPRPQCGAIGVQWLRWAIDSGKYSSLNAESFKAINHYCEEYNGYLMDDNEDDEGDEDENSAMDFS